MYSKGEKMLPSETNNEPKSPQSIDHLKHLYNVMAQNQVVTEANKTLLVETFKSISEILIWGDQNDSTVFDFFLEKNDISLEELRQYLNVFFATCRQALIETINADYSNLINLMDDFIGLGSNIDSLIEPLKNILNDIELVKKDFTSALDLITQRIDKLQVTRRKRKQLESLLIAHQSLTKVETLCSSIETSDSDLKSDIRLIERIAIQMEEISVNLENNSGPLLTNDSSDLQSRVNNLSKRVNRIIDKTFNQAIARSEGDKIQRLYRIFLLHGKLGAFEKMLITKIRPVLVSVISESRLEALGTEKFFTDLKNCLLVQFNIFFHLESDCSAWFISRIWSEVVNSLSLQSPSLFASGNPDSFHSNYSSAVQFLQSMNLEGESLSGHCQLHILTDKFNIQIYFRIRFQEIASRFEYSLKRSYTYQPQEEPKFIIPPLIELLRSITDCWSTERIYLPKLFTNFWKLTLQLIARCTVWLSTIQLSDLVIENVASIIESSRLKTSLVSTIFSQTEKTVTEIEKIYPRSILPLKPEIIDEKLLKESLDHGLIELARTGLPNIVKLTKECLVNKI